MTKILYVEDELSLAKIVKETLESKGYSILHISDGHLAVSAFQSFKPDLCILDIMLPNKDGYSIAQDIRALDGDIPIIFLSAKDSTVDVINGFSTGGNDYIRKPFSLEELIVRIDNLLQLIAQRKSTPSSVNSLNIGKLIFNAQSQELISENESRRLTYRETQLLKMLVDSNGSVVSRKAILDGLWGDDHFFNSRNLDVYITKLRDYLKKDGAISIITLKGVGYRFVVSH
jgi:two-component system, OmpR family, response regulator VicR